MLRIAKVVLALALAAAGGFLVFTMPATLPGEALSSLRAPNVKNGETMFNAGGCASCHVTPGEPDKKKLGGGLALATAFGTFRAPNISPDQTHGIGGWTELQFANAMLKGVGRGGEHLYPAFPYTSYQRMPLVDVRDLFAYIKTLPPIASASPAHDLEFPFNVRRALGLWKLLYVDGQTLKPDPARSDEVNRGAYLVEGPGHCGECHSPRNFIGGIDSSRKFAGGPDAEGKGWVPNITPHEDGLASWSLKDMIDLLTDGSLPDGAGTVADEMELVAHNTGKLTIQDRTAMAAYLKALPARPGKRPARAKAETDKK